MTAGKYAEAGALFERCALDEYRGGHFLEMKISAALAVKAYSMSGDGANALRFGKAAVDAFAAASRVPEIAGFANKALESLRTRGQAAAAEELSKHISDVVGSAWSDPAMPQLPAVCASCGAVVKPAEVVRPTPTTVACKYCGASLRG